MTSVESEDVRLHYELSDTDDRPVLVLANSLGSNLHMWDKVLPLLQKRYRLLRYDMRGHGQSSVPQNAYAIEQLGSDLLLLMDRLSIRRAHICGLSLGGMVAMWIGIHQPQRVDRMIFANTAARIGSRELWEQRIASAQSSGMDPLARLTIERWFTPAFRNQHPSETETARQMIAATNAVGYTGCCGTLRDTDLRSAIPAIKAPCLVISATHDPATPPSDGQALHAALPNSRYVELDASHLSAWESPNEFAVAVLAFLEIGERSDG